MSPFHHLDVVGWLSRLVSHRTVAGQSNRELIEDVETFLAGVGVKSMLIPGTREGTTNLYAEIGPSGGSGVLLSAHTDVVAADAEEWTSDPFSLVRRGSRLYGRGATDMKGFIAVVLAAVPALVGRDLRRPLAIALSADEELGVQGVGPMLNLLVEAPHKPAFCVVGEPTTMRVAVAHKGKITLHVRIRGRAEHSSVAPTGVSAIAFAASMINELYAYQALLAARDGDPRFRVPYATVNVGRIDGGTGVNVVAGECVLDVEIRALPRQDLTTLIQPVIDLSEHIQASMRARAPEAAVTVEIRARYPGLDDAGDVAPLVAGLAESDYGLAVDFGTEAGTYQQRLGVPVVVCGPGDVAQAHTVDEFIEEEELARAERFVHRLADWLCNDI